MEELVLLAYLLDLNEPGVVRASGEEVLCKMIKILFSSLEIIPNKPSCLIQGMERLICFIVQNILTINDN